MSRLRIALAAAVPCVAAAWIPASSTANRVDRVGFLLAGALVGFGVALLGGRTAATPPSPPVAARSVPVVPTIVDPAPSGPPTTADLLASSAPAPAFAPAPTPAPAFARPDGDEAEGEVEGEVAGEVAGEAAPVPTADSGPAGIDLATVDATPEPSVPATPAASAIHLVEQRLVRLALADAFAGMNAGTGAADPFVPAEGSVVAVTSPGEPAVTGPRSPVDAQDLPVEAEPVAPVDPVADVADAPTVEDIEGAVAAPVEVSPAAQAPTKTAAKGSTRPRATGAAKAGTAKGAAAPRASSAKGAKAPSAAKPGPRSRGRAKPVTAGTAPVEPVSVEPVAVEPAAVVEPGITEPVAVDQVPDEVPGPIEVAPGPSPEPSVPATVEALLAARLAARGSSLGTMLSIAGAGAGFEPSSRNDPSPSVVSPSSPAPSSPVTRSLAPVDEGLPSSSIVERLASRAVAAGAAGTWTIGRDGDVVDGVPSWALSHSSDTTRKATQDAVRKALGLPSEAAGDGASPID